MRVDLMRRPLAVLVIGALALTPPLSAVADDGGDRGASGRRGHSGQTGAGQAQAGISFGDADEAPPAPGTPAAGEDPCEYRDDLFSPELTDDQVDAVLEQNEGVEVDLEGPRLRSVWRDCGDGFELLMWWEDDTGEGNPVAPLLAEALAEVRPGAVPMDVEPPAQPGVVVGLPAYFSIDDAAAGGASASASAGGFTVTVSAVPSQIVVDVGEGDPLVCDPPGSRYVSGQDHPEGGCTHLYTAVPEGGSVVVSSHVVYEASYQVDGPGLSGTFDLGTFEGAATDTDVTVREVRSVRTG